MRTVHAGRNDSELESDRAYDTISKINLLGACGVQQ
jgi:hypothetical protein